MSPSRLIDAWSGRETISDCCTLTVHQQLRQISCSFQGAWERRSGAEDGTSHFYGLSSLISAWKGWFGWGGENFVLTLCRICLLCPMSSHMAAAKLSLGQGGEHATAPPLGVKHVLQENQGSNSTKKTSRWPCLLLTDLYAGLKTRVHLSALFLESPWANAMEPFPAGSLFPLNHITGEQGWLGLGKRSLHPFSCPRAELAASRWMLMMQPCLYHRPGLWARGEQPSGSPCQRVPCCCLGTRQHIPYSMSWRSILSKVQKTEEEEAWDAAKPGLNISLQGGCVLGSFGAPCWSPSGAVLQASWLRGASQSQVETPKPARCWVHISLRAY